MKNYNYSLAKKIVKTMSNLDVAERICMGIKEDWFWTAQEIWNSDSGDVVELLDNEDADKMYNEYTEARKNGLGMFDEDAKKFEKCMFGGLRGSNWGTPVVIVDFKDGSEKMFNCYTGNHEETVESQIERIGNSALWASGCLSGPVQEYMDKFDNEDFKG